MTPFKPHAYLTKSSDSESHQLLVLIPLTLEKQDDPNVVDHSSAATREVEIHLQLNSDSVPLYYEYVYCELSPEPEETYVHVIVFDNAGMIAGEVTLYWSEADNEYIFFQAGSAPPVDQTLPCLHLSHEEGHNTYKVSVLIPRQNHVIQSTYQDTVPIDDIYHMGLDLKTQDGMLGPLHHDFSVQMNAGESADVTTQKGGTKKGRKRVHQSFSDPKDFLPPTLTT